VRVLRVVSARASVRGGRGMRVPRTGIGGKGSEALAWPPTMSTPRNKDWELPRLPARRRQRSKHARGAYKGSIQT
jgi:hypothetical protein